MRNRIAALTLAAFALPLTACDDDPGDEIEDAADDVEDAAEDAVDNVKDAADELGDGN